MDLFGSIKLAEHEFSHTKTLPNGDTIDVVKMVAMLKGIQTRTMDMDKIVGPNRSKRSGFSQKRYDRVDVDQPGVIDQHGFLLDGRHRFFKRQDRGMKNMDVHVAGPELLGRVMINKGN